MLNQFRQIIIPVVCLCIVASLVQAQTPNASVPNTLHEESAIDPAADTIHVAPPSGEKETDRASISAALDEVEPGGTVQFAPGTYLIGEFIKVPIPRITLQGHPDGTTLQGCEPAEFDDIEVAMAACSGLALTGERQTVRGLTFEHTWQALWVGCCMPDVLNPTESGERTERPHVGGHLIEDNTFRTSINGFRVIGDSPDPVVIQDNDFVNVWHAGGVNGRTAHILDNRVAVPDPEQVPVNGYPGLAMFIIANDTGAEETFTCSGNIVARNRIEGHPEGIAILSVLPNSSCRDNIVRDNKIAVSRIRFGSRTWGTPGIRSEGDSTIAGVPIGLLELSSEMAEVSGRDFEADERGRVEDNLIEGNHIVGAEGLGIEVLRASGNRIVDNTITGVTVRDPFPGNTLGEDPSAWREANGSGIWISPGSYGNEITGNIFEDIAGFSVFIEGDSSQVILREANDVVRDLGTGNRISQQR